MTTGRDLTPEEVARARKILARDAKGKVREKARREAVGQLVAAHADEFKGLFDAELKKVTS